MGDFNAKVAWVGRLKVLHASVPIWARRLREGKLPNSWKNASVIIIHKKGDTAEINKKIRPISLLYTNHVQCVLSVIMRIGCSVYVGPTSTDRAGWLQVGIFDHRSHSSDQSITGKGGRIQDPPLIRLRIGYEKVFDSNEFNPPFDAL